MVATGVSYTSTFNASYLNLKTLVAQLAQKERAPGWDLGAVWVLFSVQTLTCYMTLSNLIPSSCFCFSACKMKVMMLASICKQALSSMDENHCVAVILKQFSKLTVSAQPT